MKVAGHTTELQLADPPIGILFLLAMSSIAVYGVMLAGWSSGSKYPLLGSVRASAQMVSYEAALGLGVLDRRASVLAVGVDRRVGFFGAVALGVRPVGGDRLRGVRVRRLLGLDEVLDLAADGASHHSAGQIGLLDRHARDRGAGRTASRRVAARRGREDHKAPRRDQRFWHRGRLPARYANRSRLEKDRPAPRPEAADLGLDPASYLLAELEHEAGIAG